MDKHTPPAMGGGGVANRQLPPNRETNDAFNPKQPRVRQKISVAIFFWVWGLLRSLSVGLSQFAIA
jgi:hypothetical protein